MKKWPILILFAGVFICLFSCKKDKDEEVINFDKAAYLTNIADQLIIPGYADFDASLAALDDAYQSFKVDRTAAQLENVRQKWKAAYIQWQWVKMYDFGPAMNSGLKSAIGTFPTDTALVQANIAAGSYDLAAVSNIDAIGLSSLDYLLYHSSALSDFTSGDAYINYGQEVIQKMRNEVNTVVVAWTSYRSTFIASTGNESTSLFSMLVNDFCQDFEEAKAAKLGIPIGKYSLGIQSPEYIEARYSGISLTLLYESMDALYHLYMGMSASGSNGIGYDDYLVELDKSNLATAIKNKFDAILTSTSAISGTLESTMSTNPAVLDDLFDLISGQVIFLKTDMSSAFGILITYQDNDGD